MQSVPTIRSAMLFALMATGVAEAGTLTMKNWRVDDKALRETALIPAFQKKNTGIDVKFAPLALDAARTQAGVIKWFKPQQE